MSFRAGGTPAWESVPQNVSFSGNFVENAALEDTDCHGAYAPGNDRGFVGADDLIGPCVGDDGAVRADVVIHPYI